MTKEMSLQIQLTVKGTGEKGRQNMGLLNNFPLFFIVIPENNTSEFPVHVSLSRCFDLRPRLHKYHHSALPGLLEIRLLALCRSPDPPPVGDYRCQLQLTVSPKPQCPFTLGVLRLDPARGPCLGPLPINYTGLGRPSGDVQEWRNKSAGRS